MHFLNVTIDNDGRVTVDTSGMSYEQLLTVVLTVLEGAVEEIVANAKEALSSDMPCRTMTGGM